MSKQEPRRLWCGLRKPPREPKVCRECGQEPSEDFEFPADWLERAVARACRTCGKIYFRSRNSEGSTP